MKTYISMIRGINVGGKRVKMADLKDLYLSLNLKNVTSYIQSGNVIFRTENNDSDGISKEIQEKILDVFGYEVTVIIKTLDEFKNIIDALPFDIEEQEHLYLTFLSDKPQNNLHEIDLSGVNGIKEGEKLIISSKEVYLYLPYGYGRTKLNNNFLEKKLHLNATTRNWKTVNKLYQIASSIQSE
jgi:uncharacterized protein (DUF1697 family)